MIRRRRGSGLAAAVALAVVALVALAGPAAGPARAAAPQRVAVVVVPHADLAALSRRGAVGLLVPGSGTWVSRAGALAALEQGHVRRSGLGGVPHGRAIVRIGGPPAPVTVYVELPPAGRSPNDRRYPVAVVGDGWHGLLVSRGTRIPGLVSVADVAPAVVALGRGARPGLSFRPASDAAGALEQLDARLHATAAARGPAAAALVLAVLVACSALALTGSTLAARWALLTLAGGVLGALAAAGAGWDARGAVAAAVAAGAGPAALGVAAVARGSRATGVALALAVAAALAILWVRPAWGSFSAFGPDPGGGGRFYGLGNEETALLALPALAACALLPFEAAIPAALLAVAAVGLSRDGADAGGAIALLAALGFLFVRRLRLRLTPLRVAAGVGAVAALVAVLVGIDAASGGSSHVTSAAGGGPGTVLGDVGDRLHVSALAAVGSWPAAISVFVSLAGIVAFALWPPRFPLGDALLVAIAASLLLNDSPAPVAGYGVLACAIAWGAARFPPPGDLKLE